MKIAVRSPNWIGDCIMSLPALRALKKFFPNDDIFLIAKKYLFPVYQNLEAVKEIITIPDNSGIKESFSAAAMLKRYNFDAGILLTNSFSSALLFKLSGIKKITGYNKDMRGFMLDWKLNFPGNSQQHHIFFYMDLMQLFIEKNTGHLITDKNAYSTFPVILNEEKENLRSLLHDDKPGVDFTKTLVGLSPSAAYGSAKQWLPERFAALIQRSLGENPNLEFLIFGSEKEREKINGIIERIDMNFKNVHNLAGRLSLRETMTAISLCDAFVGNDSGLIHVAAGLKVPLAVIFGPTKPHNTAPVKDKDCMVAIIYHPVHCAPCNHRDCPTDHICMKDVSVDEVADSLKNLLNFDSGAGNE